VVKISLTYKTEIPILPPTKGSSYQTALVPNLPIVSDQRLRNEGVRTSFVHDKV